MAYYNNFPATYQPMFQPQYPVMQTPQQNVQPAAQQQGGITWVQGEAGAKSYLVAPNTTVQLWDSEDKVIYLKSADASGMPSMKILDYTIRGDANTPSPSATEYATKSDLDALKGQIDGLRMRIGKLAKKEADDE